MSTAYARQMDDRLPSDDETVQSAALSLEVRAIGLALLDGDLKRDFAPTS